MAATGLIISILALGFSLFIYFKHDSKIKKQSALINEYQIDQIKEEKQKSQKAIIEGNLIKGSRGKRVLKVYNKGRSIARDVNVIIPETKGFLMNGSHVSPIELRPQQNMDIDFIITMGAPDILTVEFNWKDDFSSDNFYKQTFPL